MACLRLDLTGHLCPIPVHETRRAMGLCSDDDVLEVISDDPESLHDIPALCERKGYHCQVHRESEGIFTFIVSKLKTCVDS